MICKYAESFCWKNVSSFCTAKATHIFSAKNIRILYIESAKTVNEMTLNELVKLTMLWTTGPWFSVCLFIMFILLGIHFLHNMDTNSVVSLTTMTNCIESPPNMFSWIFFIFRHKNIHYRYPFEVHQQYFFLFLRKSIYHGYSLEVPQKVLMIMNNTCFCGELKNSFLDIPLIWSDLLRDFLLLAYLLHHLLINPCPAK